MSRYGIKSLQKSSTTLLEASQWHLLVTPPSHFIPQKVKGWFDGFTWPRVEAINQNLLLTQFVVKKKAPL
jgi:hypothetical protein